MFMSIVLFICRAFAIVAREAKENQGKKRTRSKVTKEKKNPKKQENIFFLKGRNKLVVFEPPMSPDILIRLRLTHWMWFHA